MNKYSRNKGFKVYFYIETDPKVLSQAILLYYSNGGHGYEVGTSEAVRVERVESINPLPRESGWTAEVIGEINLLASAIDVHHSKNCREHGPDWTEYDAAKEVAPEIEDEALRAIASCLNYSNRK